MQLGSMAWTEIEDPIVVVPVGSCEQHGPHLPLQTDTIIAEALASELAERRSDCVVAPTITITASGEHAGFPGTLSIGTDVMADVVVELVRSADWASRIVIVNGHGGNAVAIDRARRVLADERRDLLIWSPRVADGDLHAGHTETSLLLALASDHVRSEAAVAGPLPTMAELIGHGVRALSESGVLGDPTTASAEHGARLFDQLAADLATSVDDWVAAGRT